MNPPRLSLGMVASLAEPAFVSPGKGIVNSAEDFGNIDRTGRDSNQGGRMNSNQRTRLMLALVIEIKKAALDGDFDLWFALRAQRDGWHRVFRAWGTAGA
jgi:hypothetical protein